MERTLVQKAARENSSAVSYVRQELKTSLKLSGSTTSDAKLLLVESVMSLLEKIDSSALPPELSQAAENFVNTVDELDKATEDLLEASRQEIAELSKTRVAQSPQAQSSADLLRKIDDELGRRRHWDSEARELQEKLEDEKDGRRREIETLTDLLKYNDSGDALTTRRKKDVLEKSLQASESFIERMIGWIADNERALSDLAKYKQAVQALKNPPLHLLDARLPQLPSSTK